VISPINDTRKKPKTKDTLWTMMEASYQVLNKTNPNLTEACWLCYGVKPPYYEALGMPFKARRLNGSNPSQCSWERDTTWGLTIEHITGRGRCVG
ncbi:ENV1 protein, partial [Scytalopus superciliaris]|nr:ENV1 protein [Scytalopus superciliaris]